jgi:hypothetical protein
MAHLDDIVARLPQLYRDGDLLRGVLGAPAVQVEVLDEVMLEVQRAHWFDTTLELDEAVRLAGVLDIAPQPWHVLATFRGWVRALRDAMLREGAVTRRALMLFVGEFARAFQDATDVQAIPPAAVLGDPERWHDTPSAIEPALVENPRRRVFLPSPVPNLEPLQQFPVQQRGIDPVMPTLLFVGTPASGESSPVLINITTREALAYTGTVPPGQRLWLTPKTDGGVTASLEGTDVTGLVRSVTGVEPGKAWSAADEVTPPRALTLRPGQNQLWFLPVARYDARGLDRALLALPDLTVAEGRWDTTPFDTSLFYEEPGLLLRAAWREAVPASFEIQLPSQLMLSRTGDLDEAVSARAQLGDALDEAVGALRAAGVASRVVLRTFTEGQGQRDRLTSVQPITIAERGPGGADQLADTGGVFGVTSYNDSTFR